MNAQTVTMGMGWMGFIVLAIGVPTANADVLLSESWDAPGTYDEWLFTSEDGGHHAPYVTKDGGCPPPSLAMGGGGHMQAGFAWHKVYRAEYVGTSLVIESDAWLSGSGCHYTDVGFGLSPFSDNPGKSRLVDMVFNKSASNARNIRMLINHHDPNSLEQLVIPGGYVSEQCVRGRIVIRPDLRVEYWIDRDGGGGGFDWEHLWTTTNTLDPAYDGVARFYYRGWQGGGPAFADNLQIVSESESDEKIVFSARQVAGGHNDIYIMNPDGTQLTNLTADVDDDACDPEISPDGSRIAFTVGGVSTWVMNLDGSGKRQATDIYCWLLQWYDNRTLYYPVNLQTCHREIRRIDVDDPDNPLNETVVIPSGFLGHREMRSFDISSDGRNMALAAQRGCWTPTMDIFVADVACALNDPPAGDECGRCLYEDTDDNHEDFEPHWSADGQTVYWHHGTSEGTSPPRAIVGKAFASGGPCAAYDFEVRPACANGICLRSLMDVSPDGSKFLFVSDADELYVWDWASQTDTLRFSADSINTGTWRVLRSSIAPSLDIRPGSCPNPLDSMSQGKLPVALLGAMNFDVSQVDLSTLLLARADGVGGFVEPVSEPPEPGFSHEDIGTPFEGQLCDCHSAGGDGIMDLSMQFSTADVVASLMPTDVQVGEAVRLTLSGALLDGTAFSATDCIIMVPPEDADGDDDGVPDSLDECLGTPRGAAVDESGCACSQVDDDQDGIDNCVDECADTLPGQEVDESGCSCSQMDADRDGIDNCDDQCPDTPLDPVVDGSGCLQGQHDLSDGLVSAQETQQLYLPEPADDDEDGDGVRDSQDECPGTPPGAAVDGTGCLCSQLDGDGDGVNNCDDQCCDTLPGTPADFDGCSFDLPVCSGSSFLMLTAAVVGLIQSRRGGYRGCGPT